MNSTSTKILTSGKNSNKKQSEKINQKQVLNNSSMSPSMIKQSHSNLKPTQSKTSKQAQQFFSIKEYQIGLFLPNLGHDSVDQVDQEELKTIVSQIESGQTFSRKYQQLEESVGKQSSIPRVQKRKPDHHTHINSRDVVKSRYDNTIQSGESGSFHLSQISETSTTALADQSQIINEDNINFTKSFKKQQKKLQIQNCYTHSQFSNGSSKKKQTQRLITQQIFHHSSKTSSTVKQGNSRDINQPHIVLCDFCYNPIQQTSVSNKKQSSKRKKPKICKNCLLKEVEQQRQIQEKKQASSQDHSFMSQTESFISESRSKLNRHKSKPGSLNLNKSYSCRSEPTELSQYPNSQTMNTRSHVTLIKNGSRTTITYHPNKNDNQTYNMHKKLDNHYPKQEKNKKYYQTYRQNTEKTCILCNNDMFQWESEFSLCYQCTEEQTGQQSRYETIRRPRRQVIIKQQPSTIYYKVEGNRAQEFTQAAIDARKLVETLVDVGKFAFNLGGQFRAWKEANYPAEQQQ